MAVVSVAWRVLPLVSILASVAWSLEASGKTLKSAGFIVAITSREIRAMPVAHPARILFSSGRNAEGAFAVWQKNASLEADAVCTYEITTAVRSLVGSLLSLSTGEDANCHSLMGRWSWPRPQQQHRDWVLDLANPSSQVSLTDYFEPDDIYAALLKDAALKPVFAGLSGHPPMGLSELIAAVLRMNGQRLIGECGELDNLDGFSFHHLEHDKVAVRVALGNIGGGCSGFTGELGLLLPIPPALKKSLKLAQTGQAGFLRIQQTHHTAQAEFTAHFQRDISPSESSNTN